MNNNTLYKNCLQCLRSLDLETLLDEPFLDVVKNNLPDIIAEPEGSKKLTYNILHRLFSQLSEQYKTVALSEKLKEKCDPQLT